MRMKFRQRSYGLLNMKSSTKLFNQYYIASGKNNGGTIK